MRKMFSKAKSFITKKSTLIGIGVLVGLIYLVAPNNSVGDWRKGSSASLQATILFMYGKVLIMSSVLRM
jgi:uncharacterized BrkB/YihY/UPF0761 family membrane protein